MVEPDNIINSESISAAIPLIRASIRHLIRNPEDADDILQDTLLTGLLKLHALRPPFRLEAWLKTIARHKCIDFLKSRHRFLAWESIMDSERHLFESIFRDDPELAIDSNRIDDVKCLIDRLGPVLQDILRLRYFSGMPVKRIAEILGIPAGTVKSRLYEARQKLLQEIDKGLDHPLDLYPDIFIVPQPEKPQPRVRAGYGLCFGAPGKGIGDTEICDMYQYPGPILGYRVRSTVLRETKMWGRRVFEVRNEYSRTTGMDTRLLYYALENDSVDMVMRIFQTQPEIRVELPGDEMVPAESRHLKPVEESSRAGDGSEALERSDRVTLKIGNRTWEDVFRRSVADADDYHGGEYTESFWTPDGREVLQRLYIGENWRMGDFVSFDKLEHSQEITIGERRYRLWNEFVLVEHTPVQ